VQCDAGHETALHVDEQVGHLRLEKFHQFSQHDELVFEDALDFLVVLVHDGPYSLG